ncbi:putative quinol monooxygenase [Methanolobus bombayensis]|uniref:putative quinol monooxygenase n=1 Tax=Methanolobus bombayensis TaxID=38023 RepID=UPI001AE98FA7|nr:putative quinol monooxygenase [Methanolobus bombayensis]MBP1908335.1 quinol monooxygenase YgiN [Methanolobus bombayensis]
MKIKVVAKNYFKPEKSEDFIDLCRKLVEETLKEEGCIEYGLYQNSERSDILSMIEEWEDEHSLKKHFESGHFKEIVPLVVDFLEKEAEVDKYSNKIL